MYGVGKKKIKMPHKRPTAADKTKGIKRNEKNKSQFEFELA